MAWQNLRKTWVDLESIKHTQVREVGAKYIGYQTFNKLNLKEFREIENTFRCLKTDIDLRPIYHKNDAASMAYWLVNTVRHQLKRKNNYCEWLDRRALLEQAKQIVRIANTQKVVYSTAKNKMDELIEIKKCSEPSDKLKAIYEVLKIKKQAFTKKSVVHKLEIKNHQYALNTEPAG
jgi:hypothetical protein